MKNGFLGFKFYKTIIMDGSDLKKVKSIIAVFDMITRRRLGKTNYKPINSDHPTMLEFKIFASANTYNNACKIINKIYPGLCIFDVNL